MIRRAHLTIDEPNSEAFDSFVSTHLKLVRFPARSPLPIAALPSMSLFPEAPFDLSVCPSMSLASLRLHLRADWPVTVQLDSFTVAQQKFVLRCERATASSVSLTNRWEQTQHFVVGFRFMRRSILKELGGSAPSGWVSSRCRKQADQ